MIDDVLNILCVFLGCGIAIVIGRLWLWERWSRKR